MAFTLLATMVASGCVARSPGGAAPPVPAAQVAARAGISPGSDLIWMNDAEQAADLDAIAATGATWINIDVDWKSIQGDGPGSYRWDRATDRIVVNARARGLKILGTAAYAPQWARRSDCPPGELHCLPANPADFGRFLMAAAQRYGSQSPFPLLRGTITHWQVWNEPNHREFAMPKPNPDVYAAMLKSAYPAVKAVDPSAVVVTGGTAPAPDAPDGTDYQPATWLRALYDRGARGNFDAVGHHPYSFPTNPLDAQHWNAFTQTRALHDLMVQHGDGAKKIWATEMGAATGTAAGVLTEAQQAQWIRDYYFGWNTEFADFTGPMFVMGVRDRTPNRGAKWENLGLLRFDRSAKPAYCGVSPDDASRRRVDRAGRAPASAVPASGHDGARDRGNRVRRIAYRRGARAERTGGALARPGSGEGGARPALVGVDVEVIVGDVTDRPSVAKAVDGCDAVVHAAAQVSLAASDSEQTEAINVGGTRNVLGEAAARVASRRHSVEHDGVPHRHRNDHPRDVADG